MKTRSTIFWDVLVALAFLLGAGAAHAQVVFDPDDTTQAIGIDNLNVDGTTYNVDFTTRTNPQGVYGDFPGALDFNDESLAEAAHDAVDNALNGAGAQTVAAEGEAGETVYIIGYEAIESPDQLAHLTSLRDGSWGRVGTGSETIPWIIFFPATKVFATFTPVPEPGATLSMVAALATLGVVRRWRRKGSEATA